MRLMEIFQNVDGSLSSRRVVGISVTALGVIGKIILFIHGLTNEIFNITQLDGICDNALYAGCSLLGVTIFDFFQPKNNKDEKL